MRYTIVLICLSLLLVACGDDSKPATKQETSTPQTEEKGTPVVKVRDPRTFGPEKPESQKIIEEASSGFKNSSDKRLGYWVGAFGKNRINLTITDIRDGNVQGYSVCAGNFRPLQGTIEKLGNESFSCVLNEPGDDQYDGIFTFELNPEKAELVGTWKPFKSEGNSERKYALVKKDWEYNAEVGKYSFASERAVDQDELWHEFEKEELGLIRNEIYARHGYSFKKKEYRYHFESKDWYFPISTDVRDQLTDIEVANIATIYDLEEYYDDYYDDFGR